MWQRQAATPSIVTFVPKRRTGIIPAPKSKGFGRSIISSFPTNQLRTATNCTNETKAASSWKQNKQKKCTIGKRWCTSAWTRTESNRNRRNRNPLFYPLNYGSESGGKDTTKNRDMQIFGLKCGMYSKKRQHMRFSHAFLPPSATKIAPRRDKEESSLTFFLIKTRKRISAADCRSPPREGRIFANILPYQIAEGLCAT